MKRRNRYRKIFHTKTEGMPRWIGSVVAAFVIVSIGFVSAWPSLNSFPAYIHAWSQADWYSIAVGFQNNGFDFFHPETMVMNKQFPGNWMLDDGTAVTSVDFPIHPYVAALLMHLFGTSAPWVFRLWTLVVGLVGIWFLFLFCRRVTDNYVKSLAVTVIALTSPLWVYYSDSFLPSVPAIAFVFMGLWAYTVYYQEGRRLFWPLSLLFLTVATLMRTSQAVPLVALCCFEALRCFSEYRKQGRPCRFSRFMTPVVLSAIMIVVYMLWNAHLRAANGSMFLNSLQFPKGWSDVERIFDVISERWKYRYFSRLQHWTVAAAMIAALFFMIVNHKRPRGATLCWLVVIYLFGALLFFVAMMRQFCDHDYYFLDSLFVPVILVFLWSVRQLPSLGGWWKIMPVAMLVVGCGSMYNAAKHDIHDRQKGYDRAQQCGLAFDGADKWLDEVGVGRDEKILTLFAYPQNAPFIKMGRQGYSVMWIEKGLVESALTFNYDRIIIEDSIACANFHDAEYLFCRLERVVGNGRISLYRLCDSIVATSPDDFFLKKDFVGMKDGEFIVNGEPWFPLMLNYKTEIGMVGDSLEVVPVSYYRRGTIEQHFDTMASWGFNAVRVCLDVLSDEMDTASMFRATRRMVQKADSAGLRVMLLIKTPFEPYWQSYTKGLLRALADLPALWAYDFMNEPLYFDPVHDREKEDAVNVVEQWRQMVRTYAPFHLFTVATAEPIEVFEWDPSMLPVDFIEMHTYHPLRVMSEMWWYSHYGGKPWMVGETGLPADNDSIPYEWQALFLGNTFLWAQYLGAIGYGWWEFGDSPEGVNFEAQYTGLRDTSGHRKPAVKALREVAYVCNNYRPLSIKSLPVNYYNMLAYTNVCVTGRVVDQNGNPVEGAVIRGWNDDWSVGMNTYTDSNGRFTLYSNDYNVHFEVSAPHMSRRKFDRRNLRYKNVARVNTKDLPDRNREYQRIDYRPYMIHAGDSLVFGMDFDSGYFNKYSLMSDMGTIKLKRICQQ